MTTWLLLALAAPLLWGSTNVLDGALRKNFVKSDLALTWIMAILRLPFVVVFFLVAGFEVPSASTVIFMFTGGILWMAPVFIYYKALEKEDPSNVALLLQMLPLTLLIMAYFVLGEGLSAMQGIAFIFLIIGGGLASIKKLKGIWHFSAAFYLVGLACILWSTSDVIFKKFEPEFSNFLSAFAIYFLASFLASLFIFALPSGRVKLLGHFKKLPKRAWFMIITTVVAGVGGSFVFAKALTLGKAALTSVLIGIQPFFVIGLGLFLGLFIPEIHKEDLSKKALVFKGISFVFIILGLVFLQA